MEKLRDEGSDGQIYELRGTRKPRRGERSTLQRRTRKMPWKAPPSGRHVKRETDNGQGSVKRREKEETGTGVLQVRRQETPSETVPDTSRPRYPSC